MRASLPGHSRLLLTLAGTLSISALTSVGCGSHEAKSASDRPTESKEIARKLEAMGEKLTPPGLYYDDDVRSSIDAMPRSLVEAMVPSEGYTDENASRASDLTCTVDRLYGEVTECARSLVNFLRAYAAATKAKRTEFSAKPEWKEEGGVTSVVFDSRFYELQFRTSDAKLIKVRYRAVEE